MYWLYIEEHIIQCNTPAALTLAKWIPIVLGIPRNSNLFQDMQMSKDKKSWPAYSIRMFVVDKLKGTSLEKLSWACRDLLKNTLCYTCNTLVIKWQRKDWLIDWLIDTSVYRWQLVVAPYKVIKTVLECGFHPMDSGFCIPGQWNRFPNAEFWTPKPRILDSQAKISQIPESG